MVNPTPAICDNDMFGSTNQLSTLYETGITGYRTNDGRKFDFLITDVIDNQISLYAYLYE